MTRDPLPPELLAAWLDADTELARSTALDAFGDALDGAIARDLLALATGGPGYGGDRGREVLVQRDLLGLARAVAERVEAWDEAGQACLQLALTLPPAARRTWLEHAARHALTASAWELLARVETELAVTALAARTPRESLAARSRALAACRRDPLDAALLSAGDDLAEKLLDEARRLGDPRMAWTPLGEWLAHARKAGDMGLIARACERLGTLAGELDRLDEADRWLGEAAALYGEQMEERALAQVFLRRMTLAFATGDLDAVTRRAADVLSLRERTSDPEVRQLIDDAGGI